MKKLFKRIVAVLTFIALFGTYLCFDNTVRIADTYAATSSEYSVGDVIEFGSYPQSKVTDNDIVNALDELVKSKEWVSYDYYSNNTASDYMSYCDLSYNGTKYRAVTFAKYRGYYTTDVASTSNNSRQKDNGYYINNIYYFEYEKLKWQALDPEKGLFICQSIIDGQAFNNYYNNGYGDAEHTYLASDYEKCSLRSWLNETFYKTAFSLLEQNSIETTLIETKSPTLNQNVTTEDKVFLLSYDEATNKNYGLNSSSARKACGTDYAKCQGITVSNVYSRWRLRTPYGSGNWYVAAGDNANPGDIAHEAQTTSVRAGGIRPAIVLSGKQTHVIDDYKNKNSSYADTYYSGSAIPLDGSNSTLDMCIPELSESYGMIPQGIGFSENMNAVLISSYYKKSKKDEGQKEHPSKIYTLDFDTGTLKNEYSIKYKSTGKDSYGHVGGVAAYGETIYVTNNPKERENNIVTRKSNINVITKLDNESSVAEITQIYDLTTVMNGAKCSYLSVTDGVLWTGNFYKAKNEDYNTVANPSEKINSVVVGYKLNADGTFDPSSPTYRINIPNTISCIQGATVKDNKLFLNTSYGKGNPSKLYIFDVTLNNSGSVLSEEVSAPGLPMAQNLFIHNGNIYTLSESGAYFYLKEKSDKDPTDVVWKINYSELMDNISFAETANDISSVSVSFKSGKEQGSTTLSFKQSWLKNNSTFYNHNLAQLSSQFTMLGYGTKKNVVDALEALGFTTDENYIDLNTGRDEENFFIAHRNVLVNNEKYVLVFVGLIGSNGTQWNSDFDPYGKDREEKEDGIKGYAGDSEKGVTHLGFADAREFVYGYLSDYVEKLNTDLPIKVLMTGHSRGAAAANLLAAKIIKSEKIGSVSVAPSDVFTYTFATPNVTKLPEKDEAQYNRIFNIVNPEDFVTKVLPADWDFGRYGTTYTLPSKTNGLSVWYKFYYLNNMQKYYEDFTNDEYQPYAAGEEPVYNVVERFTSTTHGLDEYYKKEMKVWLDELTPYEFFTEVLCPFVNDTDDDDETNRAIALIENILAEDPAGLYRAVVGYFLKNQVLSPYFEKSHNAYTYCAYMMSMSKDELCKTRDAMKNSVNCPVDIEIYDKLTGELVGKVVNNVVDEKVAARDDAVVITVDGDSKQFWLPAEGYYDVILIGNDDGVMDYTVSEINSDSGEIKRSNFFDVNIVKGESMTGIPEIEENSLSDYCLNLDSVQTIDSTAIIEMENLKDLEITTASFGKGYASKSISATSGDYVTISAIKNENAEFYGWYVNDELVSSDETYSFVLKDDLDIEAEFSRDPGDSNGDNRINSMDALNALMCSTDSVQFNQFENSATDVNGDGDIDSLDALMILQYSVGIITEFKPIEE